MDKGTIQIYRPQSHHRLLSFTSRSTPTHFPGRLWLCVLRTELAVKNSLLYFLQFKPKFLFKNSDLGIIYVSSMYNEPEKDTEDKDEAWECQCLQWVRSFHWNCGVALLVLIFILMEKRVVVLILVDAWWRPEVVVTIPTAVILVLQSSLWICVKLQCCEHWAWIIVSTHTHDDILWNYSSPL